jgi:hypothetical protein
MGIAAGNVGRAPSGVKVGRVELPEPLLRRIEHVAGNLHDSRAVRPKNGGPDWLLRENVTDRQAVGRKLQLVL